MLLALCQLKAQQTKLPSERIFIYPEQSSYDPGDTVRVHGQLFASGRQQPFYSQYVYVELFNLNDSVLIRKKQDVIMTALSTCRSLQTSTGLKTSIIYGPIPG